MGIIGSILLGVLAVAAVAGISYLAYKVTASFLRNYKMKKTNKLIMANMGDLIKNMPDKDKHTVSISQLEDMENETVVAEYDENNNEVVQADFVGSQGMSSGISNALRSNDGVMIIDD